MSRTPHEKPPTKIDADFPEEEIAQRRDEVTRRMLNTPYTPQQRPKAAKKKKKAPAKA
ncbi:MAG: hypothetical protein K2X34_11625 [Hyphomonadaceae bacterium]|nr:hypothetical protein [Hyphomonadaceae bacterium]